MKSLLFTLLGLTLIASAPAHAARACYSSKEEVAEKIIRLHSELMVITVTCKQSSSGQSLSKAYSRLTRKHLSSIKQSESILKAFYKKHKGGNGNDHIDRIRTKLANQYSQMVAKESAAKFCKLRRDRVVKLQRMRYLSFEDESIRANSHIDLLSPVCKKRTKLAQRRQKWQIWE